MNYCTIAHDNSCLLAGGDDCTVRLFQLGKDFKPTDNKLEFKIASMPINCVDINASNSVMVAASKDGFTYIVDMKTQQVI